MNVGYIVLIAICLIALVIITLNIAVIKSNKNTILKNICILLFILSFFRYFTLMVYGDKPTYQILSALRYFYFATSLGLTVPTLAAIWYITPLYREKIKYPIYLLLFTPWIVFYLYIILMQPTKIIVAEKFGYSLKLVGSFSLYLSIAQGSFIVIVILLCLFGIMRYQDSLLRSRYVVFIIAQIALTLDGLSYFYGTSNVIPPFTVTEVFGFLAILYAFSKEIRS